MFGSSKESEDAKKSTALPASGALNALVKGTVIEGTLRCDSDLRVDGTIKGNLSCQSKVIIGPTGAIEGEVRCQNAVIEGKFKGKLYVTELLNVRETAEVEGEISTNKLIVQSGANFNVACKMEVGATSNGTVKHFDLKTANDASSSAKTVATGAAGSSN